MTLSIVLSIWFSVWIFCILNLWREGRLQSFLFSHDIIHSIIHMVFRMDFLYTESMARRKVTKESIRKVQQTHGSYHISIPMRIMRMLGWRERQKVVVKKYGTKKIVISDWVKKKRNNKKP